MSFSLIRGLTRVACTDVTTNPRLLRYYSNKKVPKISTETVKQNVKGYVFKQYIDYVRNYDKLLEKKFPSAVRVYRIFLDGMKEFYKDLKKYIKVSKILYVNGIETLTRSELELYHKMSQDMIKVAPALFFSTLPFVGNLMFPLAYMYPRKFLSSHFWSIQQRVEFRQEELTERLLNSRKVFRHLQSKLRNIKNDPLHKKWSYILGLLGSGRHPTVDDILTIQNLFIKPPYGINNLSQNHIKNLCQLHGVRKLLFKRAGLIEHANLIRQMDRAISQEGGAHNLTTEQLKYSCFLRGLSPTNLSNESMYTWLKEWILVSRKIEDNGISLYLHLPILLAYNHPNNWRLIH